MLGYEISIRCICGQETKYKLNALRYPVITLGRKQKDGVSLPDINVCEDETGSSGLSRFMLYFAYNKSEQDWFVGAGFPLKKYHLEREELLKFDDKTKEDANRSKKQERLFYFPKNRLFTLLDRKFKEEKDFVCDWQLEGCFLPLTKEIKLSDIAGIGIVPVNREKHLVFQGSTITGVSHPLMGKLPFGWYLEVKNNRSNYSVIRSHIQKTHILEEIIK